jgi:Fe-S cluster assembly protein SufD
MITEKTFIDRFADFEAGPGRAAPPWIREIRRAALDRFEEHGFPTPKSEDWRFTRVRPLLQHDYALAETATNGLPTITDFSFKDDACSRLVFVNGHFSESLSAVGELPEGALVTSLRTAFDTDPELVRMHLARHADTDTNPFVALNTAYLIDGAFVYVPRATSVDTPIHLLFIGTAGNGAIVSHPRNLIVAEDQSRATILESYVGSEGNVYLTNAVTEIVLGENASVDHCKVQKESEAAYHIASLQAHMGGDSRFVTNSVSLGGMLVRNDIATVLDGEGIECTMDGLYMADGHQHVDNHTAIEHAKPHCDSHELYKGILNGRAKAVFNGRIHVHPDAQKTDAKQSNGCLLLSDDAQINTIPQLEIFADDVKCTHGATVGQLDDNAVFYLRSRGIGETDARHMLIHAFANEVLERIKVEPLRAQLEADLYSWLTKAR